MKFTVQKANIISAMDIAVRAIPSKTTSPVLYDFKIEVKDMEGVITSNDMSTAIKTRFTCMAEEPGEMCISAKTIMQAIKKMGSKADISFATEGNKVIVTGGKARYEFPIEDVSQYPDIPKVDDTTSFTVNADRFRAMIDGVAFSVGQNLSNKVCTAINMKISKGLLLLVSTDMSRVSIRKSGISCTENVNVNVPSKAMIELSKSLNGGDLQIETTKFHVRFTFGNTMMVARLVDGNFFNTDNLYKNKPAINVKVDTKELSESIDRAMVIVNQDKIPIILDIKDNSMAISLKTNISNFDEEMICEKSGADIRIGLNPAYVLEALRAAGVDTVSIGMHNALSPIFIEDDVADEYSYVVLPINI